MLSTILTCLPLIGIASPDFESDAKSASETYGRIQGHTDEALTAADLPAAQAQFLAAVPEDQCTAAHWFMLGNMWFEMDPAFAYRMHEKAFALAPQEADVVLEWALELQRAGKWSDAAPLYEKLVALDEQHSLTADTMRAECLLELGRYADAASTWARARAKKDNDHVRMTIGWVHGPEHPIARRARILGELRAGKLEHAEELLLGDVFWRKEGAHYFLKYEYMEHDGKVVNEKLGDGERRRDLDAFVGCAFIDWEQNFPRREDCTPRKELVEKATERKWIGDAPRLPKDDRVAAGVVRLLREHSVRTPEQLLTDFGDELTRRASAADAGPDAASVLVELAKAAKSPKLDSYKALAKPEAPDVARQALDDARKANHALEAPLVALLRAEFRAKRPDLTAIDKAFVELGKVAATPR